MEEIQEDDLPHEFLGEVHGVDALDFELVAESLVFGDKLLQPRVDVAEQFRVFGEELLSYRLHAESFFNFYSKQGPFKGHLIFFSEKKQ